MVFSNVIMIDPTSSKPERDDAPLCESAVLSKEQLQMCVDAVRDNAAWDDEAALNVLHDEAERAVRHILTTRLRGIVEYDGIDYNQRRMLVEVWEKVFWDKTHKVEREEMQAEINRLRRALQRISKVKANSNSDPDRMGDALDSCVSLASAALKPRKNKKCRK